MQKRFMDNKGISPILATVLLIGFVIILGFLVWLFFSKTIQQATEKVQCGPQEGIQLSFSGECTFDAEEQALNVKIINNGQQTIDGVLVVARSSDGTGVGLGPTPITVESGEEQTVSYGSESAPASAEIFPYVVKGERAVACVDQTVTIACS